MDKAKTSNKLKKSPKKFITINGVKLFKHDPKAIFKKHKEIKLALSEAFMDGDKEAFVEILAAYVKTHNVSEVCRRTGLSRTVVYEAISEDANPSLDTLFRIITSFEKAA